MPETAPPPVEAEVTPPVPPPPAPDLSGLSKFLGKMIGAKEEAPKEEAKPDGEAPPVEAAATETPKPKAKKPKTAPQESAEPEAGDKFRRRKPEAPLPPEPVDYERIAEASGRGAAQALSKAHAKATLVELEVPEEEQHTIKVFETMEKMYPKQKGISDRYRNALKRQQEYESAWQRDHPAEQFDPDADEHNEFFEKNAVDYDDKAYFNAAAKLMADESTKDIREEVKSNRAEIERERRLKEAEPTLQREEKKAGEQFFAALGDDDFSGIVTNGTVDTAKVNALFESNPAKAEIVFGAAAAVETVARAASALFSGLETFNEKRSEHIAVNDAAVQIEDWMLRAAHPEDQLDQDGRQFAPIATFQKMTKAQQARHWTVDAQAIHQVVAYNHAEMAKKRYDQMVQQFEKVAPSLGYQRGNASKQTHQPSERNGTSDSERTAKPRSPAATSAPIASSRETVPVPSANSGTEALFSRMLAIK